MQEKVILGRVKHRHSSFLDKSTKGAHAVLLVQVSCHLRLPSKVFHKPLTKEQGCRYESVSGEKRKSEREKENLKEILSLDEVSTEHKYCRLI